MKSGLAALLAAVLVAMGAAEAEAQRRGDRRNEAREEDFGRGFFQVGIMRLDVDDLNARLATTGFPTSYPTFDGEFLTLGGGGFGGPGRLLIGGEGHALLPDDEDTAGGERRVSLAGAYALFRLGYRAATAGGFDIYPLVGVGGGGMSLGITDRSSPTFNDVLNDPSRSSTLTTGMLLLDASIGATYRFGNRRGSGDGGMHIGVQAGYTIAPAKGTWDLDDINDVAGAPDLRLQGFYLRGSIGGWGRDDD